MAEETKKEVAENKPEFHQIVAESIKDLEDVKIIFKALRLAVNEENICFKELCDRGLVEGK